MKKLICVLKATMSGNMNIFKFNMNKTIDKKSTTNKIIIAFLVCILLGVGFSYAYMFAEPLKSINMTYVMLELFAITVSVIVLIECVYKSQGILFETKDNDLLFSMPIDKKVIISSRLIKLLIFEYIFDFIFFVPAIVVYAILENTMWQYWIVSITMLIAIPIIPTVLGSVVGYLIKVLSNKFKKRKVMQTITTLLATLGIIYFSFNMQSILLNLSNNANTIDKSISTLYYPIKLYILLIQEFNIKDLVILILLNISISVIFVIIFSISYFSIISKGSEVAKNSRYKLNNKSNSQFKALIIKDFKRFFASPVYIVNAGFGLILLVIASICICVNFKGTIGIITQNMFQQGIQINTQDIIKLIPMGFLALIGFIIPMSMITPSAISIEGKSFAFMKTLPVSGKKLLFSKVIMADIIVMIPTVLSAILVAIRFDFGILNTLEIIAVCVVLTNLISTLGLIINLIIPKMDAKNDTEIVKQSASTLVAMIAGMGIFGILILLWIVLNSFISFNNFILILIGIFLIFNVINCRVLSTYGEKRLYKI